MRTEKILFRSDWTDAQAFPKSSLSTFLSLADTYDGVTAAGCFSPGHVPCAALHELIRIVKPGMIQIKNKRKMIKAHYTSFQMKIKFCVTL